MHAGVIPFIALAPPVAASLPLIPAELVQNAALLQVAYGASIASFLGGVHWALAMVEYGGGCFCCCMAGMGTGSGDSMCFGRHRRPQYNELIPDLFEHATVAFPALAYAVRLTLPSELHDVTAVVK